MPQSAGNECFRGTGFIAGTDTASKDICSGCTGANKHEQYQEEDISEVHSVHKRLVASVLMHHLHMTGNIAGRS
jgi:hypothetical protein